MVLPDDQFSQFPVDARISHPTFLSAQASEVYKRVGNLYRLSSDFILPNARQVGRIEVNYSRG